MAIAFVRGQLAEKELTRAVVDVHGVGYELAIPLSTFDRLPPAGQEVTLKTHLVVREDSLTLYGFATVPERSLFVLLVETVTGIGPKLALNILSAMTVQAFCAAVVNNDLKTLCRINGVGKRSAERLVVELRDKLADLAPQIVAGAPAGEAPPSFLGQAAEDAIAGLTTLGYKTDGARKAVHKLLEDPDLQAAPADKLIRLALGMINR